MQPTFKYTHCKSAAVKKKKKERAVKSVKGLLCSRISSHCDNPRHGASYQLPGVFRGKHSDVKITPHAAHERICKHSSLPFTTDASSFCCSSSHMHCNFPANICHSLLQIQFHRFQTQVSLYKWLSPSCAPFFFFLLRLLLVSRSTNARSSFPPQPELRSVHHSVHRRWYFSPPQPCC